MCLDTVREEIPIKEGIGWKAFICDSYNNVYYPPIFPKNLSFKEGYGIEIRERVG